VRPDNSAALWGSRPRGDAGCGGAAMLFLALAFSSSTAAAQRIPQPVFTELFSYDPATPSELLRKWRISSQLDSKLQPLRVGVVEDPIGKTVGRITVQEGDGLAGANEAMLQGRQYICDSEGSRATAVEAKPGGVVPSERAEIQVRSDRATGAGELVKFGELLWYRFSFKVAGDWPHDVPIAGRQLCRTVIHQIKQDSFRDGQSCDTSPFLKIEARPIGEHVRFFAQVASGSACAWPPRVMRTKICGRQLPREIWTTVQVPMTPAGGSTFGSTAHFATPIKDQWPITNMAPAATECPSSTHSHGSAFIVTGARRPRRSISTRSFSGTPTRRDTRTGG
jgi:hypothetical protein